jgi:hypothetical protein
MRRIASGVVCVLALAAAAPAGGDAVIERLTRSDGIGGMGGFESTTVTLTSPGAEREEMRFRFTGGFLGAIQKMAGMGDSVRITRLDRDLVWTLDPERKTYTEEPLTARGERARPRPGQRPPGEKDTPPSSDWVVTRNELTVEKTGNRKAISGFPCEEYLLTWLLESRNTKTAETARSRMTNRMWTTPETAEIRAVQAVQQAYGQAYLKKIGLQMSPAEAQQYLAGLTSLTEAEQQKALARLGAEMQKVQGFTIAYQLDWGGEGEGGPGAGGQAGGGQGGGGQQDLGQVLGRLFGGGGQKGSGERAPGGGDRPGGLLSVYSEIKGLRTTAPEPARFEVPAGFTRK